MPLIVNSVSSVGNLELIQKIINEGADFNLTDYRGRAPIHVAAINGNLELLQLLLL